MKALGISLLFLLVGTTVAQETPTSNQATIKYHGWRSRITEPVYGLAKVKALVKKLKMDDANLEGDNIGLSPSTLAKLTIKEKFTYHMIHGEFFTQNCDVFMAVKDEEKNIYAYPPQGFGHDNYWSDAQRAWFKKNRKQIIPLLRETMKRDAGSNVKAAILEADAHELIPDIIRKYKVGRKDQDLLSTLNMLMLQGKYEPFLKSQTYQKLYSEDAQYRSSIVANKANQDLIMKRAMDYYSSKRR